jgi:superfamily II DNA or RNA helicase
MLAQAGRSAVIHPTGTGKSFIGFKFAEERPDSRIVWLSPSEYIFKTQVENLKAALGGGAPDNINFITYTKLMLLEDAEIELIKPGFIILDEFHRCGAAEWGKGVARLLTAFPEIPVLGLSATNIRYLDNQRDMADELFDGNIASEMTLGEAVMRNILLPPVYITSIYSYQKDLEKYQRRADRAKGIAARDKAQKYLDELRRTLTKADGLDVIFDKYIKDRDGKFIVFCANIEHMREMISLVPKWFGEVDGEPHIYSVCAVDAESEREFAAFKQDDSGHLKLLFCVDMLNEGIHVEDISGVILFRPTVSPIIYKQQIGRALSASKGRQPMIFDIVNNFENLYSIGTLESEVREAVLYYRERGREDEIVNADFRILDEVRDCRQIFFELQDSLSASWELMYEESRKYYEEHGDLLVPYNYKSGYLPLGSWIATQRLIRRGNAYGVLSDERIQKLDAIDMVWDRLRDYNWNRYYEAAQTYYETYGDLNVGFSYKTSDGIHLGKWLSVIRARRKQHNCSNGCDLERITQLDEIGMVWDKREHTWISNYAEAKKYFAEYGHLDLPRHYKVKDGIDLGDWLLRMRAIYWGKEDGTLTPSQIEQLNDIGMDWSYKADREWELRYAAAKSYYEEHGHLNVPLKYRTDDGIDLGQWIYKHRKALQHPEKSAPIRLTDERRSRLDAIGMIWDTPTRADISWSKHFTAAKEYYERHGHLNMTNNYKTGDGVTLGYWLSRMRGIYLNKAPGKISTEQIEQLTAIGMVWQNKRKRTSRAKGRSEDHTRISIT